MRRNGKLRSGAACQTRCGFRREDFISRRSDCPDPSALARCVDPTLDSRSKEPSSGAKANGPLKLRGKGVTKALPPVALVWNAFDKESKIEAIVGREVAHVRPDQSRAMVVGPCNQ